MSGCIRRQKIIYLLQKKQKRSSFRGGNKQKKRIFGNTLKNTEHDRDKQALQHQGKRE